MNGRLGLVSQGNKGMGVVMCPGAMVLGSEDGGRRDGGMKVSGMKAAIFNGGIQENKEEGEALLVILTLIGEKWPPYS